MLLTQSLPPKAQPELSSPFPYPGSSTGCSQCHSHVSPASASTFASGFREAGVSGLGCSASGVGGTP
ncbi:hypothetical protein BDB00DRAFT_811905, partial [Zychaea mexicana]|uniref:uncharacterized protein n=1 Tax=Zychaea mexicana TaxID=64656 RepID=UPI0022FE1B96